MVSPNVHIKDLEGFLVWSPKTKGLHVVIIQDFRDSNHKKFNLVNYSLNLSFDGGLKLCFFDGGGEGVVYTPLSYL